MGNFANIPSRKLGHVLYDTYQYKPLPLSIPIRCEIIKDAFKCVKG